MLKKEQFNKVMEGSTKEEILNQYYYDYKDLRTALEMLNEIIKILTDEKYQRFLHDIEGEDKE